MTCESERIYTIAFQPANKVVTVEPYTTIYAAASRAGIQIVNVCQGRGTCMQCRVRILKGNAPPDKDAMIYLSEDELKSGYVLACHTPVCDDLEIFVPGIRQS